MGMGNRAIEMHEGYKKQEPIRLGNFYDEIVLGDANFSYDVVDNYVNDDGEYEVRTWSDNDAIDKCPEGYYCSEKELLKLLNGNRLNAFLDWNEKNVRQFLRDYFCIENADTLLKPFETVDDKRKLVAFLCGFESEVGDSDLDKSETVKRNACATIFGKNAMISASNENSPLMQSDLFSLEPDQIYEKTSESIRTGKRENGTSIYANCNPNEITLGRARV